MRAKSYLVHSSILVACLAFGVTACGDDDEGGSKKPGIGGAGGTSTGGTGGTSTAGTGGTSTAGTGGTSTAGTGGTGGTSTAGTGGTGGTSTAGTGGTGGTGGSTDTISLEFEGKVGLSATKNDRFWAAAVDSKGRIYGAGFVDVGTTDPDHAFAVARFDATGALDTTFGTGGIFVHNIIEDGGAAETARDIVIQADDKVILAGHVENTATTAFTDLDLAVLRLNEDGTLDTSFGTDGVSIIDLSTGESNDVRDQLYGADIDATGRVVLFGMTKTQATDETHRDRFVARLTAAGALDETFNAAGAVKGVHVFDVDGKKLHDSVRLGFVQPDGKIFQSGYTNMDGGNKIVLARYNADGTLDSSFGTDGVVISDPLPAPGMAEAYGAALQTDGSYVTTGYGRVDAGPAVDLVSFRYDSSGAPDSSWGSAGGLLVDISGANDRGRHLVGLPDDRTVMVGSGIQTGTDIDAMIVVTTKDGELQSSFGTDGIWLKDFGGADDALFGADVSADGKWVVATGFSAGAGTTNEDATLVILKVGE